MWISPVSYQALDFARLVREALEALNYVFTRDLTSRTYSRFVVIMPMMGGATVYRYSVEFPSRFVIQCYDTYPGTMAGLIPFVEINRVDDRNKADITALLQDVAGRVSRPPWEFTRGQRLLAGYLLPEFGQARKAWAGFGFDTSKRRRRNKGDRADVNGKDRTPTRNEGD